MWCQILFFDYCICGILQKKQLYQQKYICFNTKKTGIYCKITPSTPNEQKEEGETEIQTELKKQNVLALVNLDFSNDDTD